MAERYEEETDPLLQLALDGSRRTIEAALRAEADEYIERHRGEYDGRRRALVVRYGFAATRNLAVDCGVLELRAPRVNDRRVIAGQRRRFRSELLSPQGPAPSCWRALPALYLLGLATRDPLPFVDALFREVEPLLSARWGAQIGALLRAEADAFGRREFHGRAYDLIRAGHLHFTGLPEGSQAATTALLLAGRRRDDAAEEILALRCDPDTAGGWLRLLRDLSRRGLRAPTRTRAHTGLAFWAALRSVWRGTIEEVCE